MRGFILAVLSASVLTFIACSSTDVDSRLPDASANPAAKDASSEGGLPDTNVPGCPNNDDPLATPDKCFDEVSFVYVNVAAAAGGDGTKAKPFQKLADALASTKTGIVMAQGEYKEAIEVQRTVKIFGGLAPSFVALGEASTIASGATIGLTVKADALLSGVSVRAEAATEDGGSSVGIVADAVLTLVNGTVTAGGGKGGKKGDNVRNYDPAMTTSDDAIKGNDAPADNNGFALTKSCSGYCTNFAGLTVSGGRGGAGGATLSDPSDGAPGQVQGADNKGVFNKGATIPTSSCSNGTAGAEAANANGGTAASAPFKIEGGKVVVTVATDGTLAKPGQGGGGGGGMVSAAASNGGGSGGCGGCGGGAGKGGQSGGSSIAVLLLRPGSTIRGTKVVTGTAGTGGDGGDGQPGQTGGIRGVAQNSGSGCNGGPGGAGGHGGGGGGGAGGYSVGVAFVGARPTIEAVVPSIPSGPAGGGGAGATGTGVTAATPGPVGKNALELPL